MFAPGTAFVLKNVSPTEQVAGGDVPVLEGLVDTAPEKSTLLLCVLRSTRVVCPQHQVAVTAHTSAIGNTLARIIVGIPSRLL
jgi:hypothetical protein